MSAITTIYLNNYSIKSFWYVKKIKTGLVYWLIDNISDKNAVQGYFDKNLISVLLSVIISKWSFFYKKKRKNFAGCLRFNKNLCPSCLDAYPISEIVYTWKKGPLSSVEVPQESSSLLQYDLIGQTVSSERLKSNTGEQRLRSEQYELSAILICFIIFFLNQGKQTPSCLNKWHASKPMIAVINNLKTI